MGPWAGSAGGVPESQALSRVGTAGSSRW